MRPHAPLIALVLAVVPLLGQAQILTRPLSGAQAAEFDRCMKAAGDDKAAARECVKASIDGQTSPPAETQPPATPTTKPHILTLAPPPSLDPKWWAPHTGYTLAKMGMSFVTLGLAAEFGPQGVAVNALWPRTVIATDAINMIPGVDVGGCRIPEILADAAHAVLTREAAGFSGQFLLDDEVLAEAGITDLSGYAVDPTRPLMPDLFLD